MKKWSLVLLAFLVLYRNLPAQSIDSALQVLLTQYPVEKTHVHTDREAYFAGETIWFKAYLFSDGKPSPLSQNFFAQLISPEGKLVREGHFPVLGAVAKGQLPVPDSLPEGIYTLRALTTHQLQSPEDFIYKKPIAVYNPAARYSSTAATPGLSLRFFPESGQLVAGILTVVAFKATDEKGQPVALNGLIQTEEGSTVAPFRTLHDGMGRLQFKPLAGKKYLAEVQTPAGKRQFLLPEVQAEGVNLKLQDEKGGKKFQLSRSVKDPARFSRVRLVAQVHHHLVYDMEIEFENYPSVIGHIITDSLPSGILHFTLFSEEGLPLAERLGFVNNGEYRSSAGLEPVLLSAGERTENSFRLLFPDSLQHSCSVSVTDADWPQPVLPESIYSRLLLTGDLKGPVHNPAWYFEQPYDSTRLALDNLLLTQGWRRFVWKKILEGDFPVVPYRDNNLLEIAGSATEDKTGKPVTDGTLTLYMETADSSTRTLEPVPGPDGQFRIDSLLFEGKAKFYYGWLDRNGKVRPVNLLLQEDSLRQLAGRIPDAVFLPALPFPGSTGATGMETRFRALQDQEKQAKELERVTVRATAQKKPFDVVNEKYTTGVFRTPGKENLDNINEPVTDKGINAIDYIKNRIQQLDLQRGVFVNRKNFSLVSGQNWTVGIFLNEMPADMNQLRILRAMDIALVKFYEAGFVGVGSTFPGGALAVYTREKSNRDQKPDQLPSVTVEGYTVTREFYQPDYTGKETRSGPDFRTTLYWNPDIITGKEAAGIPLKFFNNDRTKRFRIVLEGFDAKGRLIHAEKIYTP